MKKSINLLPVILSTTRNICLVVLSLSSGIQILQAANSSTSSAKEFTTSDTERFKDISIQGTITDKITKAPLSGAMVKIKGLSTTTFTGADGKFAIRVADANTILVISILGYKSQEVKASTAVLNIALETDVTSLSEVVISGYATQNRAEFIGSSAHVSGEDLASRPVPSFDQALSGQAAGVKITSSGGALNSAPVFRIRGTNSISLSSYPLIIIDGITSFTGDVGNSAENNPLTLSG